MVTDPEIDYILDFQDLHTLPKRNILSHSCYCGLLSLLVYSGLSGPAHPPKEKYSVSQLLLWLALSARIQWPFRTSTPSQREIFCLTAVIVACSFCSYTVAFQDQHTLPKRNIRSHSCYCGLLSLFIYSGLSGPAHPPKEKYSLKAVIVACSVYLRFRTSTPSQREIFVLFFPLPTSNILRWFNWITW